ncbi:hypothetical protein ACLGIH_08740 [Streptomyces sp. HMX87]|uniref:hypothetical protein n=1 Tax=Streptomyces sp. HMX87 TaxID=3390849 RepID=UPI003A899AB8
MAWEEWEQIKSEAAARHATRMQLNQLPADGGGSSGSPGSRPDLASSQAEKQAAARAIEHHIEDDTRKAGNRAETDTNAAVKAFAAKDGHGWVTSGALKKAHKTWEDQVQNLMNRLSADKEALRGANKALHSPDLITGNGLLSIPVTGTQ